MQADNEQDIWDMIYENEGEKLSFTGKTPKTITELLLGVKQYMENLKQQNEFK